MNDKNLRMKTEVRKEKPTRAKEKQEHTTRTLMRDC